MIMGRLFGEGEMKLKRGRELSHSREGGTKDRTWNAMERTWRERERS